MKRRIASLFGFAALFGVAVTFAQAQDAGLGGFTARPAMQSHPVGGPEVTHALIFDAITGLAGASGTTSTPNTFIGEAIDGSAAGGLAPKLTGFDCAIVNFTGATVTTTNLRLNAYVWGTHLNSGAGNVFSNLLATYTVDFGPVSLATSSFIPIESATPGVTPGVVLATPLQLTSNQNWGMTFNWQTETATPGTYVSTNNFTQALRVTGPFAVGTPDFAAPNFGYYRNAGSENTGNFLFSSARNIGANSGVYMRAYAEAVPEPTSLAVLGLSGLTLIARRRKA